MNCIFSKCICMMLMWVLMCGRPWTLREKSPVDSTIRKRWQSSVVVVLSRRLKGNCVCLVNLLHYITDIILTCELVFFFCFFLRKHKDSYHRDDLTVCSNVVLFCSLLLHTGLGATWGLTQKSERHLLFIKSSLQINIPHSKSTKVRSCWVYTY